MIDKVYEVETLGGNNWWVTKETYEKVKRAMHNVEGVVEFNSISGAEAVVSVKHICAISFTTLANRQKSRAMNKEYKTELPAEYEET